MALKQFTESRPIALSTCGGVEGCDDIVEDISVSSVGEVVSTDLGASSN